MKAFIELKRLLIVVSVLSDFDYLELKKITMELEQANSQLEIEFIIWNGDKKTTQKKEYKRKQDEWLDKDFSFFGKLKNLEMKKKFDSNSDILIVLEENLPNKVVKVLNTSSVDLKIAFGGSGLKADVLFSLSSQQIKDKLSMLQNYLVQKMWKQTVI